MQQILTIMDLINACGSSDRLLVVGEKGELKLAVLAPNAYYQLVNGAAQAEPLSIDPEEVNKKILQAQLEDAKRSVNQPLVGESTYSEVRSGIVNPAAAAAEVFEDIDPSFNFDPPVEK